MEIDFDELTHTYKLYGSPVPSVTQVIGEIIGSGWKAAEWYLTRGRAIHKCAEFICMLLRNQQREQSQSKVLNFMKKKYFQCGGNK